MSARWIQNDKRGMARIEPRLAVVDPFDRFLFITPVMFTAFGFFLAGTMPIEVLGAITASCFVGDGLIVLKNAIRAGAKPAEVTRLVPVRRR